MQNKVSLQKRQIINIYKGRKSLYVKNPRSMIVKVDKQFLLLEDSHENYLDQKIIILKSEYKSKIII